MLCIDNRTVALHELTCVLCHMFVCVYVRCRLGCRLSLCLRLRQCWATMRQIWKELSRGRPSRVMKAHSSLHSISWMSSMGAFRCISEGLSKSPWLNMALCSLPERCVACISGVTCHQWSVVAADDQDTAGTVFGMQCHLQRAEDWQLHLSICCL